MGEISGWYKKHLGYGQPKEGKIKTGLKGEFGDLLFYLTKLAEICNMEHMVSNRYEPDFMIPPTDKLDVVAMIGELLGISEDLIKYSHHSQEFISGVSDALDALILLINHEGWTVEDIQLSNLAKLAVRHKDGFDHSKATPDGRNLAEEDKAL